MNRVYVTVIAFLLALGGMVGFSATAGAAPIKPAHLATARTPAIPNEPISYFFYCELPNVPGTFEVSDPTTCYSGQEGGTIFVYDSYTTGIQGEIHLDLAAGQTPAFDGAHCVANGNFFCSYVAGQSITSIAKRLWGFFQTLTKDDPFTAEPLPPVVP